MIVSVLFSHWSAIVADAYVAVWWTRSCSSIKWKVLKLELSHIWHSIWRKIKEEVKRRKIRVCPPIKSKPTHSNLFQCSHSNSNPTTMSCLIFPVLLYLSVFGKFMLYISSWAVMWQICENNNLYVNGWRDQVLLM